MTATQDFFRRYDVPERAGSPKYARLRDALLAAIEDGLWGAGERLPDEQSLARDTPFSLGTVQKALGELARAGVVVRRRGHGTFVATARPSLASPLHLRFEDDEGGYLPVYPRVVLRAESSPPAPWSLDPGAPRRCLRIDRVYSVADEFSVHTRFFIDDGRFPLFRDWPVARLDAVNFKQLLQSEYGVRVERLDQRVRALALPLDVTRTLGLRPGAPGLGLDLAAWPRGGAALYFQQVWLPQVERRLQLPGADTPSWPGA